MIFRKRWSGFRWISVDDEETDAGSWHWEWNAWGIQSLWQKWRRTDKVISTSGFKLTPTSFPGSLILSPVRSPRGVERRETLETRLSLHYAKFENGGSPVKTHQIVFVHTTQEKYENGAISSHFGFVFEEYSVREITWLSWRHRFRKAPFSNCFSSTLKRKANVLQIPPVWRTFSIKLRFRDGLVWTVGLTDRNKTAFSSFPERRIDI